MLNFNEMLDNAYNELEKQKKNMENVQIPKPNINIQSNKKTVWKNAYIILERLKRSKESEHFLKYINEELNKSVTWKKNKEDGLMIDGIFKKPIIQNSLTKYIEKFIVCDQCNNINTRISKNKKLRLWNFKCMMCGHRKFLMV
jgi:translation initiation factor 2 subunit 2